MCTHSKVYVETVIKSTMNPKKLYVFQKTEYADETHKKILFFSSKIHL